MISFVEPAAADQLVDLYREQYRPLVRLAALLLDDRGAAEEVVQDAFVQLHQKWGRVVEPDKRVAYLRSMVMNGARSRLRRRLVRRRLDVAQSTLGESAEQDALRSESRREVLDALRSLPHRQHECLVLRYYSELSEAEIAAALGISTGSVKTHTHRGIAALERALEPTR